MANGVPGPPPQTGKRELFARLIGRGMSNAEACRIVGIHPRTGRHWRFGRTITRGEGKRYHYPPVVTERKAQISPRYLSEDERTTIADLRRSVHTLRAIVRELGRDASTVSRELRRNVDPTSGHYRPFTAQHLASERRGRPGRGKLIRDPELRAFVAARLKKRWSPEQISRALRSAFPDQSERHLVPETIYQAVYRPELGGLHREAPKALRTGRHRRKPQRRPDVRRPGHLVRMTMISERPAAANDRSEPGHWEGDLIIGAGVRSAVGTVVDRSTRFTLLLHLEGRHDAETLRDALLAAFAGVPPQLRRSLTWDQGSEMALHAEIADALRMTVFFCDRGSPWQRPTNENTNGLLRQYFPKGTDLAVHTPQDLTVVAAELNSDRARPSAGPARPSCSRRCCCEDDRMADMRRRGPEPPAGMPQIRFKPGLADETMRELAPLLAEEGIDVDNLDVSDMETLQRALNRAVERRNMQLFTPVGPTRDVALVALRLIVEAILDGNTKLAGALLEQVQPESPDNTVATVSSCIGIALGLLDEWLTGQAPQAPPGLGDRTVLPPGHWHGERAGTDVLVLARKGRAFRSLQQLITRQGGPQLLAGSALALAAAVNAWARTTGTPPKDVISSEIR